MKRLESSAASPCFSSDDRHIALMRRRRFETRLMPLQYVVWLGIALAVGVGIAALGSSQLSLDHHTVDLLTDHFTQTRSFYVMFGRLCLSLLPICVLWSVMGFAYYRLIALAALLTLGAEGILSGTCLLILFGGSYPLLWGVVYAAWRLLRTVLILYMVIRARTTAHKRQEAKWLSDPAAAPRTHLVWIGLAEWLCGTAICAIVSGLYLLI